MATYASLLGERDAVTYALLPDPLLSDRLFATQF